MNDQPQSLQVPTIEQLTQAITQAILQRSQARDAVDNIEKQLPVLQGQLQLLQAQAKVAKAESTDE